LLRVEQNGLATQSLAGPQRLAERAVHGSALRDAPAPLIGFPPLAIVTQAQQQRRSVVLDLGITRGERYRMLQQG
jgi:hypothetical protein